jgi:hypothetical protein
MGRRNDGTLPAIARRLGARPYVNAPGGPDLYDPAIFRNADIDLRFLGIIRGQALPFSAAYWLKIATIFQEIFVRRLTGKSLSL